MSFLNPPLCTLGTLKEERGWYQVNTGGANANFVDWWLLPWVKRLGRIQAQGCSAAVAVVALCPFHGLMLIFIIFITDMQHVPKTKWFSRQHTLEPLGELWNFPFPRCHHRHMKSIFLEVGPRHLYFFKACRSFQCAAEVENYRSKCCDSQEFKAT